MASKKKSPSFEIPEAVRHAGQAGWVYRTGAAAAKGHTQRRAAARPAIARAPKATVTTTQPARGSEAPVAPPTATPPAAQARAASVAGRLVGFGLQVAAVPFMVPLFLTAAVSQRRGAAGDQ